MIVARSRFLPAGRYEGRPRVVSTYALTRLAGNAPDKLLGVQINADGESRGMTKTDDRLRRLLEVGETLVSELDPDAVLQRILREAQHLTGARYAALGVLDEQ